MNKKLSIAEQTACILKKQIESVEKIYVLQKDMYKNVLERDWLESEKCLRSLDKLSKEFKALDKELYTLVEEGVFGEDEIDFFAFTKSLNEADKTALNTLYKTLKEKLASSKIENEVFSSYITHAQSLVQGVINIISEERNGKCYTRTGKHVNADMTSLVLNETL
ncbi:flagellar export chaperone FlgN [Treponema pedis]|uniref:FlgN protein n=1 Tax=Treponema pedis str. T A4 TaxID=1291379 RepID=S5ZYC7_9SPIR|nr:flagellar export chaperone FlgN [Treponema pedis]AGT43048.1 hypothetical protein TPE_0552 [Treponema pedis str. T A4]